MQTQRTIAVLLSLLLAKSLLAHPAHESNAEMVWNADSKSLEVALKVKGIDLETALTPKGSKRIDLDETHGVDLIIKEYLANRFKVESSNGKQFRMRFAGKTVGQQDVWLYFEFPLDTVTPIGCSISNRIFFESLENQTNKVEFRSGRLRYSLVFDKQHPIRRLQGKATLMSDAWTPPQDLELLPSNPELPDLFKMADGNRVSTVRQWNTRREEIKQIIQYYEYGHLPPRPDSVTAKKLVQREVGHSPGATQELICLSIGSKAQLALDISIHLPESEKPHPVILVPVHRVTDLACMPMFLKAGYAFIQYQRDDLDPDKPGMVGPAQSAYPESDWATLAVWAWGAMRVVDYLETRSDIDLNRIAVTGHSRDGKAALLAGALDERFALVAPNGSGCGGAGCFRNATSKNESLGKITDPKRFGYWFHHRLSWFAQQEDRLPFDQHFVKAVVAPRALLCTEARGDLWSNPTGTWRTSIAARDVYSFLNVKEKMGLSYRDGQHDQTLDDWRVLLEFAQWHFFGEKPADTSRFWQSP